VWLVWGLGESGRGVQDVFQRCAGSWGQHCPADNEQWALLKAQGFIETSNAVGGVIDAPEKQRRGVYGTTLQMELWGALLAVHS